MSENNAQNSKIIFDGGSLKITESGVAVTPISTNAHQAILRSVGGESFNSWDRAIQSIERYLRGAKK